jgi:hypothetical protein
VQEHIGSERKDLEIYGSENDNGENIMKGPGEERTDMVVDICLLGS